MGTSLIYSLTMAMTRLTRRKFKAFCYYVVSWIVASLGFTLIVEYGSSDNIDLASIMFMLQLSIFMGISHGMYDVVVLQDEMDHRSAWLAMLIRSLFFISSICCNFILCILLWGNFNNGELLTENSLKIIISTFFNSKVHTIIFVLFIQSHLITFVRSVHKKFGSRVFINTLLGKSQDPTEEDRIFMFIDMKKSTTIAEDLGHVDYSNFMKDYYKLLSNCCEENRGEIYQIAGDGAFITWKTSKCKYKARPIDLFYDFAICLEKTKQRFIKKYGTFPSFKAGAHCGKVISTEVGNFGSEMAYHGDVLNATSRIQSLCAKLGQDFLISEDLFIKLPKPFPHDFMCKREGIFELKGRKREIFIFSLQKA